jgi:hypothetical protein
VDGVVLKVTTKFQAIPSGLMLLVTTVTGTKTTNPQAARCTGGTTKQVYKKETVNLFKRRGMVAATVNLINVKLTEAGLMTLVSPVLGMNRMSLLDVPHLIRSPELVVMAPPVYELMKPAVGATVTTVMVGQINLAMTADFTKKAETENVTSPTLMIHRKMLLMSMVQDVPTVLRLS